MTEPGIQTPRRSRKNEPADARSVRRCGHRTAASTARLMTGTKNRKQACPWMRNQPVRAKIHASWARPDASDPAAITNAWMRNQPVRAKIHASWARPDASDPAAITNTMYASTYMYGIQSEVTIWGWAIRQAQTT